MWQYGAKVLKLLQIFLSVNNTATFLLMNPLYWTLLIDYNNDNNVLKLIKAMKF